MYLYWFNKYAWIDKVWKVDDNFIEETKIKKWDLLNIWEDYYLVLWKEVSFIEQYVYWIKSDISKIQIIEKRLLNKQNIELLHRMVYQRYSTYKNVSKLFLPQEIDKLIDRKISKKIFKNDNFNLLEIDILSEKIELNIDWQILFVFPDLRTLINLTSSDIRNAKWVDLLVSTNTQNQKDKSRRNIKNWNTKIIFATHSEIFQNYKRLSKIIIIQPHKRYYSSQQDPRYKTFDVVKKLAEIWGCKIDIID